MDQLRQLTYYPFIFLPDFNTLQKMQLGYSHLFSFVNRIRFLTFRSL